MACPPPSAAAAARRIFFELVKCEDLGEHDKAPGEPSEQAGGRGSVERRVCVFCDRVADVGGGGPVGV